MLGLAREGATSAGAPWRVVVQILQDAVSIQVTGLAARPSFMIGVWRRVRCDVALQREVVAEQLLSDLRRAVAATKGRPMPPKLNPPRRPRRIRRRHHRH